MSPFRAAGERADARIQSTFALNRGQRREAERLAPTRLAQLRSAILDETGHVFLLDLTRSLDAEATVRRHGASAPGAALAAEYVHIVATATSGVRTRERLKAYRAALASIPLRISALGATSLCVSSVGERTASAPRPTTVAPALIGRGWPICPTGPPEA